MIVKHIDIVIYKELAVQSWKLEYSNQHKAYV